MIEFMQKNNLSIGSLGISRMLEGIEYFFEGQYLPSLSISYLPNMTVSPTANFFY